MRDPMTQRPHDATVLLEHAAFLRGLARSLVFDVDAADDVEQETWRAALEHPPRDLRSPRGWLATIARNVVRARLRSDWFVTPARLELQPRRR